MLVRPLIVAFMCLVAALPESRGSWDGETLVPHSHQQRWQATPPSARASSMGPGSRKGGLAWIMHGDKIWRTDPREGNLEIRNVTEPDDESDLPDGENQV